MRVPSTLVLADLCTRQPNMCVHNPLILYELCQWPPRLSRRMATSLTHCDHIVSRTTARVTRRTNDKTMPATKAQWADTQSHTFCRVTQLCPAAPGRLAHPQIKTVSRTHHPLPARIRHPLHAPFGTIAERRQSIHSQFPREATRTQIH